MFVGVVCCYGACRCLSFVDCRVLFIVVCGWLPFVMRCSLFVLVVVRVCCWLVCDGKCRLFVVACCLFVVSRCSFFGVLALCVVPRCVSLFVV